MFEKKKQLWFVKLMLHLHTLRFALAVGFAARDLNWTFAGAFPFESVNGRWLEAITNVCCTTSQLNNDGCESLWVHNGSAMLHNMPKLNTFILGNHLRDDRNIPHGFNWSSPGCDTTGAPLNQQCRGQRLRLRPLCDRYHMTCICHQYTKQHRRTTCHYNCSLPKTHVHAK